MVVKKTPRPTKSTDPSPDATADNVVSAPRPRRARAAGAAAPKASAGRAAAKPKTPRAKPATVVPSALNDGVPAPTSRPDADDAAANGFRAVTEEDIRIRAYFLSLEHRGQGSPEYFWQLAERELRHRSDSH